jgi:hypothetical protein
MDTLKLFSARTTSSCLVVRTIFIRRGSNVGSSGYDWISCEASNAHLLGSFFTSGHIPHNRPILLAFVHDSGRNHESKFESLAGKKNVIVAYNFRYNQPLLKPDSPFYNAELRSIFAHPAQVFYEIDAAVKKAWEVHAAKRFTGQPKPVDENCDDSDYIPDEDESDVSWKILELICAWVEKLMFPLMIPFRVVK